jgi:hypothetical protein
VRSRRSDLPSATVGAYLTGSADSGMVRFLRLKRCCCAAFDVSHVASACSQAA